MIKKYFVLVFILTIFVFGSCSHSNSNDVSNLDSTNIDSTNIDSINWDTIDVTIFLMEDIKTIDKKFLPSKLYRIINSKLPKCYNDIIDNYTVIFEIPTHYYFFTKVFWDKNNTKYYCISGLERDTIKNKTISYFYFLKYEKDKWKNVSHILLPSYAIDIIELQTNININYKRVHPKEKLYAFNSVDSINGIIINFEDSLCDFNLTNIMAADTIRETTFLELVWNRELFEIKDIARSLSNGLLSDMQLSKEKIYTSFNQAIRDSNLVYILDLSGQNITEIPKEINKLANLQVFIFQNNNVVKLPVEIGDLKKLQIIKGDNNLLTYLPYEIGFCSNLYEMSFKNNKIYTLPNSFDKLKKMGKINLDYNSFKDFPPQILMLKKLVSCNISNNYINYLPAEISNLRRLSYFNLANNLFDDVPNQIAALPNLKEINITGNNFNQKKLSLVKNLIPNVVIIF